MPATIHERGQINGRVALDVAADVQSQRQDSPVLLKRKQDTPVAVLLAKDLVVAIPPGLLKLLTDDEVPPQNVADRHLSKEQIEG